jgi:hypothetical protein
MLVKDARKFGKVSKGNSKVPGTTFAIDAFACKRGSKLRKIPGTPCHSCYAIKLQKLRPSVDQGWKANLAAWEQSTPEQWAQAMAFQILRYNTDGYHRWFDAGDLQSPEMFEAIVQVCRMTPKVKHWLPTQESGFIHADIPENLTVRLSASKIDGKAPKFATTSSVTYDKPSATCPAQYQGNNCGDCRACWSRDVAHVSYPKH